MGIELSREQLEAAAKGPVQIADPHTGEVYVVVSHKLYVQSESERDDLDDIDMRDVSVLVDEVMAEDDANDPALETYQHPEDRR